MSVDVATFRLRFPEFADDAEYPDARIQLFIDDTLCYIGSDESRWCGCYDKAQAYLAAHLLAVGTNTELGDISASVGPVTGKSAGGVSVTKGAVAKDRSTADDFYASTSYGMQFLNIRDMCFVGVLAATLC